ncbi:MAG: CotH kinase family protein [Oscillospiraceae bacterium]|nr:CotH kinase family protein [Candidatus Equicaccousia limihippi]
MSDKSIQKHTKVITVVAIALVLAAVLCVVVVFDISDQSATSIVCTVLKEGGKTDLKPWYDGQSGFYCFLPSGSEGCDIKLNAKQKVYRDNKEISVIKASELECNKPYNLRADNKEITLTFMRSSKVASVYIDTGTVTEFNRINSDKSHDSRVNLTVADENGRTEYTESDYKSILNGHGNSSWSLAKKSYDIQLLSPAKLLGMDASSQWVLIANAYDQSYMRNKLVYDFAGELDGLYSPQCRYTNLYVNGEYNGLYLLVQRVESVIENSKIASNGFAVCRENNARVDTLDTVFNTENGVNFTLNYPFVASDDKYKNIADKLQNLEDGIQNGDLADIDIESFAKRYLIDEVFMNQDGEIYSSYFYGYFGGDNKMYAGPIWDYDLCFANRNSAWMVTYDTADILLSNQRTWYGNLMQNNEFKKAVLRLYGEKFRPYLQKLINGKISNQKQILCDSANMDRVRWKGKLPECYTSFENAVSEIENFSKQRTEFLDSIWLKNELYRAVTVKHGNSMAYFTYIKDGNSLSCRDLSLLYGQYNVVEFKNQANGQSITPDTPIHENLTLTLIGNKIYDQNSITNYLTIGGVLLFVALVVTLFIVFSIKRKKL